MYRTPLFLVPQDEKNGFVFCVNLFIINLYYTVVNKLRTSENIFSKYNCYFNIFSHCYLGFLVCSDSMLKESNVINTFN